MEQIKQISPLISISMLYIFSIINISCAAWLAYCHLFGEPLRELRDFHPIVSFVREYTPVVLAYLLLNIVIVVACIFFLFTGKLAVGNFALAMVAFLTPACIFLLAY